MADGDRRGGLMPGTFGVGAGREPLAGVEADIAAQGVPDDPGPRWPAGDRAGAGWMGSLDRGLTAGACGVLSASGILR